MLREYQDEIKRLKDQLDATQRGVIIGEDGKVTKDKVDILSTTNNL